MQIKHSDSRIPFLGISIETHNSTKKTVATLLLLGLNLKETSRKFNALTRVTPSVVWEPLVAESPEKACSKKWMKFHRLCSNQYHQKFLEWGLRSLIVIKFPRCPQCTWRSECLCMIQMYVGQPRVIKGYGKWIPTCTRGRLMTEKFIFYLFVISPEPHMSSMLLAYYDRLAWISVAGRDNCLYCYVLENPFPGRVLLNKLAD